MVNAISEAAVNIIVIFLMSRGNLAANPIYNQESSSHSSQEQSKGKREHDQSQR